MATIDEIRAPDRSPAFYLWIAGIDVLFGTVQPPARVDDEGNAFRRSVSVIPRKGFEFSRELIEEDAIIEAETVKVHLASEELIDPSNALDPGFVFGRLGYSGADASTQIRTTIRATDSIPVVTVASNAGFAVGDIVHVGREAFKVGVTWSDATGDHMKLSQRGLFGSTKRTHKVSSAQGIFPMISKPAIFFRGRKCVIFEGSIGPNGEEPTGWIERFRGFIASEPEIATDGRAHTVSLEINPLTSVLDVPLGSSAAGVLHLSPDLHTFDGSIAGKMRVGEIAHEAGLIATVRCDAFVNSLDPEDSGSPNSINSILKSAWESARVNGWAGLPDWHPMSVQISEGDANSYRVTAVGAGASETVFVSPQVNAAHGTKWIRSAGLSWTREIDLGEGADRQNPSTRAWPEFLAEKIEGELVKADGLFGYRLDLESGAAPSIRVEPRYSSYEIRSGQDQATHAKFFLSNDDREIHNEVQGVGDRPHGAGHRWDDSGPVADEIDPGGGRLFLAPPNMIPKEAINFNPGQANAAPVLVSVGNENPGEFTRYHPITLSNAWYMVGDKPPPNSHRLFGNFEKWITLDADPLIPAGSEVAFDVFANDEDEPKATITIGAASHVTVDGRSGYRAPVFQCVHRSDDEFLTVADHPGGARVKLKPAAIFDTSSISEILLRLLCSADGESITSATFDRLQIGAGLTDSDGVFGGADLDLDSFLAIENPLGQGARLNPSFSASDTLYDVIRGVLRVAGYAIDLRTSKAGKCQLVAVKTGIPNRAELVDHFGESEIADKPIPASPPEMSIKNVFRFLSNHNPEGEAQSERAFRDTVSIGTFGEANDLEVELHGVTIQDATPGQLLGTVGAVVSRLRVEFSYPRRLFRLSIRSGLAAQLQIGGVYSITHPLLRGSSGVGVTGALCRLRSVDSAGFDPLAKCEFVFYGFAGSGWAPTVEITGAAGAVLTVAASKHSPGVDPSTGDPLEDIDGFTRLAPGDEIRLHPIGDMDNIEERTIVSVSKAARTITLDAAPANLPAQAHNGTFGFACPTNRPDAPAYHQDFAYLDTDKAT